MKQAIEGGMFIVLEGIDGTGKTTIAANLRERLSDKYFVTVTREPYKPSWESIYNTLDLKSELSKFLFFQMLRAEHLELVIKPALAEGKIVVCDRYIPSSYAYQYSAMSDADHKTSVYHLLTQCWDSCRPTSCFFLDSGNYEFLKTRVLHRNPQDNFPDIQRFEEIRRAYRKWMSLYDCTETVPITETNGQKRSMDTITDELCDHLRTKGLIIP